MSNRRFIVFFLFGIVLAAALLAFLEFRARRPSPDAAGAAFFPFAPEEVCAVEVRRAGADRATRLERDAAGKWWLVSPYRAETDREALNRMLDAALFTRPADVLSASELRGIGGAFADFGLSPARLSLELRAADGKLRRLLLGRTTPGGGETYARIDGDGAVFTVSTNLVACVPGSPDAFRRRTVISFTRGEVAAAEIKVPGSPFLKLARVDGRWRIVEPTSVPADSDRVERMLSLFDSARIAAYVWPTAEVEKAAPATYGLVAEVGAVVTFRDAAGADEQIVFGNPAGTNLVHALVANGGAIVTVDAALAAACRAGEAAFRDWRVFPFAASEFKSVSIASGSSAHVLVRGGDGWRLESPVEAPADAKRVGELLAKISALREDGLAAEGEKGAASISVSVASATNSAPVFVPSGFFGGEEALADLRSKTMLALEPASVRRLRVVSAAGETVVARDATRSGWNLAAGASAKRVDAAAVAKLLDALRSVEAENVEMLSASPDDVKRFGLDSPAFTISADLDSADAVRKNVMVGHAAPGGGRYAMIGGSDTVFVISRTTVANLTLTLTE